MKTQPDMFRAETSAAPQISCREPHEQDGALLHRIATDAGGLDVNSEYAYYLIGMHFARTSVVAEIDGEPAGFVSGYLVPDMPYALFVWQVAVLPHYRGRGVAQAMLKEIIGRRACDNVRFIDTTVTPSNTASRSMFKKFALAIGVNIVSKPFLPSTAFTRGHEEEVLLRIGPIERKPRKET